MIAVEYGQWLRTMRGDVLTSWRGHRAKLRELGSPAVMEGRDKTYWVPGGGPEGERMAIEPVREAVIS